MLQWLDGRNSSSFGSLAWNNGVLGFTVTDGANATGLQGMLPTTSAAGTLSALTRNGTPAGYATTTIKGDQIPAPAPPFGGVITEDATKSTPWWPATRGNVMAS